MNSITKRILVVVLSLLLLIYVAVQGYLIFAATLETVTAENETAYDSYKTTGVIYRDESVIQQQTNGYLFYMVQNGNRVSKNGKIASVFPTEHDALKQQEWELLNEEISALQFINAQGTSNRANLASINQQLKATWLSLSRATGTSAYMNINAVHVKLLTLLNKKQLTIGKEENFNDRIAALQQKKAALQASFTPSTATIYSPVAGYFVADTDGFEGMLKINDMENLTVADVETVLAAEPAPSSGASIGKMVGDYEWYLTCIVPLDRTVTLKKGMQTEVVMPFVQNEPLSMRVVAVNKAADDRAAVILQCMNMSSALSTVRKEEVEIRFSQIDGLRVPDEAIQFNEKDEAGVFIQAGNSVRFRKIHVLYHNEEKRYSVCEKKDDKGYLRLYDKIVIQGENLYDGKLVR